MGSEGCDLVLGLHTHRRILGTAEDFEMFSLVPSSESGNGLLGLL